MERLAAFLRNRRNGQVAGVVSLLWEAFWLVGPPMGMGSPEARGEYLAWGAVALVVALFQVLFAVTARLKELEEGARPKFDIVFLPDTDASPDSRPYLQVLKYHADSIGMCDRRFRIGVVNLCST